MCQACDESIRTNRRRSPSVSAAYHFHARVDPTRTVVIRRTYERDVVHRITALRAEIKKLLLDTDFLQPKLKTNAYEYQQSARKVANFMKWLEDMHGKGLLEVTGGARSGTRPWNATYIQSAYQKGLANAANQLKKGGVEVSGRWIDSAFFRPIHADAVALAYATSFTELKGITAVMDSTLSKVLALGMAEGKGVQAIAREISRSITKITRTRARVLARTEIIRAHAEASLNTYVEAGVEGVNVMAEFTTAGDGKVCSKCQVLEQGSYTIQQARGLIPVHPNCRCAWLPVVKNPERTKLL